MARLIPRKQIEEQQNISASLSIRENVYVGQDAVISGSLFVSQSFFLGNDTGSKSEITGSVFLTGSLVIDGELRTSAPNTIELNEDKTLFTLTLLNKKFIIDILELDNVKDYIDVYLFGVKQPQERYNVVSEGNNIIVTFIIDITRVPQDVKTTDFEIKGKIAEIL